MTLRKDVVVERRRAADLDARGRDTVLFESLQRVLPSARFALLHVNTLGEDPLKDGVFVFEPPSMWTQAGAAADFASKMGSAGVKQLFISLREIGPERSEVSIPMNLLELNTRTPEGREILNAMIMINGFVPVEDAAYEPIRRLQDHLEPTGKR